MTQELIVFTHCDLDAAACILNIEYKWPDIKKRYYHTNYSNIPQKVDEIAQFVKDTGNHHILITDVSFSDAKDSMRRLYNIGVVTHIDHHMYPDGFWDEFPDMKVHYSKEKCAGLLTNEYLGNTGKNKNLDNLTKIIDVYDIWQTKHPAFDFSQNLNEYFWRTGMEKFCSSIIANNFSLPDDFTEVTNHINRECEMAVQSYEERKLIYRSNDITIMFVNDWFNQIMIADMKKGQNFVIGINSHGIVRVRIRKESPYTDDQKNALRFALTGSSEYGHLDAFTYKAKQTGNTDVLVKEAEIVVNEINKVKGS